MRKELKYERTTESAASFPEMYRKGFDQGKLAALDVWQSEGYVSLKEMEAKRLGLETEIGKYEYQLDTLRRLKEMMEHVGGFIGVDDFSSLVLEFEPIQVSRIGKCLAASKAGLLISLENRAPLNTFDSLKKTFVDCEKFIVNKSYHSFIENKDELNGADWVLPYEECCFEFHLKANGKYIYFIVFAADRSDIGKVFATFINYRRGKEDIWCAIGGHGEDGRRITNQDYEAFPLFDVLIREIRGISILLDAGVVVREQRRVAARLNDQSRKSVALPEYEFHVLKLRQSVRYEGAEIVNDEKRRSPRLHLRRGHWRRVGSYKTWVRWSVVGDARLGMISKTYEV